MRDTYDKNLGAGRAVHSRCPMTGFVAAQPHLLMAVTRNWGCGAILPHHGERGKDRTGGDGDRID